MTEAIKSPAPKGYKRLVKVSTIQCGTDFATKVLSSDQWALRNLISRILKTCEMTARELVACLLSEPYDVPVTELGGIALALDSLNEDGLLKVGFRVHNDNLDIEPVFAVE